MKLPFLWRRTASRPSFRLGQRHIGKATYSEDGKNCSNTIDIHWAFLYFLRQNKGMCRDMQGCAEIPQILCEKTPQVLRISQILADWYEHRKCWSHHPGHRWPLLGAATQSRPGQDQNEINAQRTHGNTKKRQEVSWNSERKKWKDKMLLALKSTRLGYPVFVVLDARPTKSLSKWGAKETWVCSRIAASVQNQFRLKVERRAGQRVFLSLGRFFDLQTLVTRFSFRLPIRFGFLVPVRCIQRENGHLGEKQLKSQT